ncbi:MAG TPA: 12,18-didecarboxysiroheme deacetylase, partial [Verrucomicrobiales bacterium]|nr:12,18-didecarboxysiroheme deacetylase [Verrucomicrobiales bacterium]
SRAQEVLDLLGWNGGGSNSSGTGIGNIDTQGNVHPDQFWQSLTLGNVKEQPFSQIWSNQNNETLTALRNRNERLEGRCSTCRFLGICGGGFRVRAVQIHNNIWASDPACYLSDEEIRKPEAELAAV